jgi:tRNA-dihydrouridine synthase A
MGKTDSQFRYLVRKISKEIVLFTEMIHSNAILFGNKKIFEEFTNNKNPIVLQLGGNDPESLGVVSNMMNSFNYDEINLNIGCPSPKVKSGGFGASLMKEPNLTKECVQAMVENFNKEVSVKIRLGVDDNDIEETLDRFVEIVKSAGINVFYVHARKAILNGLSPKQNREIPPLQHQRVGRLKESFPELKIIINGGIKDLTFQKKENLEKLDGIMIGREAYSNPMILKNIDSIVKNKTFPEISLFEVTKSMFDYFETLNKPSSIKKGLLHMHGLYTGHKHAKKIRILLSNSNYLEESKNQILSILEKDIIKAA